MTHLKEDPFFFSMGQTDSRSKDHFNTDTLIQQSCCCVIIYQTECVLLTLKLKSMVCFITHITHNFPKLFFADSVMWSPWRAECWGPCRPLLESTEHLLPTAVRAAASWWRHRGTLCPPQCVTSIPGPWTKPQASRMGLACLLMLFPISYMWRACGPRAECHRLESGTNGPGFSHGQTD